MSTPYSCGHLQDCRCTAAQLAAGAVQGANCDGGWCGAAAGGSGCGSGGNTYVLLLRRQLLTWQQATVPEIREMDGAGACGIVLPNSNVFNSRQRFFLFACVSSAGQCCRACAACWNVAPLCRPPYI